MFGKKIPIFGDENSSLSAEASIAGPAVSAGARCEAGGVCKASIGATLIEFKACATGCTPTSPVRVCAQVCGAAGLTVEASVERKGTVGFKGTVGAGLLKVSGGAWVEIPGFQLDYEVTGAKRERIEKFQNWTRR
jgi:hypothetical protein